MRSVLAVALATALTACSTGAGAARPATRQLHESPALQRFVVAVRLLPSTATEASRRDLSDALRQLSDALDESYPDEADVKAHAGRIRLLAGDLQARAPSALPPEILGSALREGVDALEGVRGARGGRDLDRAGAALKRYDSTRPVLAQVGLVRSVLGHMANALLVSRGLDPAIDTEADDGPAVRAGRSPVDVDVDADAARRASALVSHLATAPSSDYRNALAAALEGFADALEGAASSGDSRLHPLVEAIRAGAGRMRRSDALGADAAPHAKAALESTLRAIALVAQPLGCSPCTDWISRARATLDAVDDRSFIAFQRGGLQETCRLIADVLVIAATRADRGDAGAAR